MGQQILFKLTIAEGRKRYHSANGILTHHHIICDPYIDIRRFATRRIPCTFIDFINSMDLPWDPYIVPKDHPRYSSITKYKYDLILGKQNDWEIMYFI